MFYFLGRLGATLSAACGSKNDKDSNTTFFYMLNLRALLSGGPQLIFGTHFDVIAGSTFLDWYGRGISKGKEVWQMLSCPRICCVFVAVFGYQSDEISVIRGSSANLVNFLFGTTGTAQILALRRLALGALLAQVLIFIDTELKGLPRFLDCFQEFFLLAASDQ